MENSLEQKIKKLERLYVKMNVTYLITIVAMITTFILYTLNKEENEILDVKGIIVRDNENNPRIVLGAPASSIKGRKRQDEIMGIVYLDEYGNDRLTFGKEPDPMTPDGIIPRQVDATGILIHDKEGIERGVYGVSDDDRALLTLDWPKTGEAIALTADKNFAAIGLFHKSKIGQYREAVTIGNIPKQQYSFIRISDTLYNERFLIDTKAANNIEVKKMDINGKLMNE